MKTLLLVTALLFSSLYPAEQIFNTLKLLDLREYLNIFNYSNLDESAINTLMQKTDVVSSFSFEMKKISEYYKSQVLTTSKGKKKNSEIILLNTKNYVEICLRIIEKEITKYASSDIEKINLKAKEYIQKNNYVDAIKTLEIIKIINPGDVKAQKEIEGTRYLHKLFVAEDYFKKYQYKSCLNELSDIPFKEMDMTIKNIYLKSLTKYHDESIKIAKANNNLSQYLGILDSLRVLRNKSVVDNDFNIYINSKNVEFEEYFSKRYRNLSTYYFIPSGEYYYSSGKKERIKSFLIFPDEINSSIVSAYKYLHNENSNTSAKDLLEKTLKWLNLKIMSYEEQAYLFCDGWSSYEEKEIFANSTVKYVFKNLPVSNYVYHLSDTEVERYHMKQKNYEDLIQQNISIYRTSAYLEKRVNKNYSMLMKVNLSYQRNARSLDEAIFYESSGLNGGMEFGVCLAYSDDLLVPDYSLGKFFKNCEYDRKYVKSSLNIYYNYGYFPEVKNDSTASGLLISTRDYKNMVQEIGLKLYFNFLLKTHLGVGYALSKEYYNIQQDRKDYYKLNKYIVTELGWELFYVSASAKLFIDPNIKLKSQIKNISVNVGLSIPIWFNRYDPLIY